MKHCKSSSNFGLSGGSREDQQGPALAECPCGNVAAWYRVDGDANAPEQDGGRAEKAVSDITSDGLPSSLCAECFEDAVPEGERERWRRIELSEEQQERHWANQFRRGGRGGGSGDWGDNQDSGGGWG